MSIVRTTIWLALASLFSGFVIWIFVWPSDSFISISGIEIFKTIAGTVAVILFYRRTKSHRGPFWNQWLLYTLGLSANLLAQLYWTAYVVVNRAEPLTLGIPELLWVSQYGFYVLALRYHIANKRSQYPYIRYYLDVLIFTVCAVGLYWHYFLEPQLHVPIYADAQILFDFICSSANAGILFGLGGLYLFDRSIERARVLVLLMLGFSFKCLGGISHLHLILSGSSQFWLNQLPDFGWFAGMLFLSASVNLNTSALLAGGSSPEAREPHRIQILIPFILIGLMLVALFLGIDQPTALMLGTSLTVTLLLLRLWLSLQSFRFAKEALSVAEEKYRNLVENSQVGVFSAQFGKLNYVNRYFADTFGYTPEQMIGTSFMSYINVEDRQRLAVEISKLTYHHEFTSNIGVKGIKSDGNEVHLEVQVTRTVNRGEVAITGTLLDITERKLAEEMIIRSEKLSVVGQLAAGVAHEIRNPLTSLKGFTQLLKARGDNRRDSDYYEIMLTELDRINYIVGEFMLLSKPQQMQRLELHSLKDILGSMLPIIETQAIIHNISIAVDWQAEILPVQCDKNQIKQVFVNVLKNAIEAMSSGGTIRINFSINANGYSCVQIADQGPGMPQETLARLGEPFFSTKSTGTGLGLMVCYRIIEAHNGHMHINSTANKGTVVEIQLKGVKGVETIEAYTGAYI